MATDQDVGKAHALPSLSLLYLPSAFLNTFSTVHFSAQSPAVAPHCSLVKPKPLTRMWTPHGSDPHLPPSLQS